MTNLISGRIQDHVRRMRITADLFRQVAVGAVVALVLFICAALGGQLVTDVSDSLGLTSWLRDMAMLILKSWVFACVAGFVVGLALGAWLDAFLRRREQPADDKAEREALALEAEALGRKIAELAGEYSGQHNIAWWQESMSGRHHDLSAEVRAKFTAKYGVLYQMEVQTLIQKIKRLLPIDRGALFRINHPPSSDHDLHQLTKFLAESAVALRDNRPVQPPPDHYEHVAKEATRFAKENAELRATLEALQKERQSPQGTEEETPQ